MDVSQAAGSVNSTATTAWGDDTGPTIWYVGVVLHLAGGALGSLGLNLQRWRHQRGQGRAPSAEIFATRIWLIGFVLLAMDAMLCFLSFAFASLCKLATLGIIALCLNTSVAPAFRQQRIHKWDTRGALIVCVGAIVAISCANPKTPNYSLDQLTTYLGTAQVVVFLCAANTVLAGLLAAVVVLRRQGDALEAERRRLRLEFQQTHATAGSPAGWSGMLSSGRSSPTSGSASESLVTAPSEIELGAAPEPLQLAPPRITHAASGGGALDLAGRLQGGPGTAAAAAAAGGGDGRAGGGGSGRTEREQGGRGVKEGQHLNDSTWDGGEDDARGRRGGDGNGHTGETRGAGGGLGISTPAGVLGGPAPLDETESQGTGTGSMILDTALSHTPTDSHHLHGGQEEQQEQQLTVEYAAAAADYVEGQLRDSHEWSRAQRLEPKMQRLYLTVLPIAAGLSGGLAVLFSKISVEMAKTTVMGSDYPYKRGHAYLFVLYMIVMLFLQVKLLNQAMVASLHSFHVVAKYQIVRLAVCVLGGILFFHEAETMSAGENALYVAGCSICIAGTLKMQGQSASLTAANGGSVDGGGGGGGGNTGRRRDDGNGGGGQESPVSFRDGGGATGAGGAAGGVHIHGHTRDDLDDMLHLLEIDTTTRNCEFAPAAAAAVAMPCVLYHFRS